MDIWQILAGLILLLIGCSIIYDDRQFAKEQELEELERENNPQAWAGHDPHEELNHWTDWVIGLFYLSRGYALALGGALLVVNGVL